MNRDQQTYERLVETACSGRTITYDDLAREIGLDILNCDDRQELVRILEAIAFRENAAGRPLLTAVVVIPEIRYPGKGFFILARELGFNHFDDERSYYHYELKRVYDFWEENVPAFATVPYMQVGKYEVRVGVKEARVESSQGQPQFAPPSRA